VSLLKEKLRHKHNTSTCRATEMMTAGCATAVSVPAAISAATAVWFITRFSSRGGLRDSSEYL
jgi:hypothetical protein